MSLSTDGPVECCGFSEQMLSDGDYDELHETIARHGWRIKAIQRLQPRLRQH